MEVSEGKSQAMLFRRGEMEDQIAKAQEELKSLNRTILFVSAQRHLDSMPAWKRAWVAGMLNTSGTNPVPRPVVTNSDCDCF